MAAADDLLASHPAVDALALWFERVADHVTVKRGVLAAVEAGVRRELADQSRGPVGDAVTSLLDAGTAQGTVRDDVDASDVVALLGCLTRVDGPDAVARSRHLLEIILDGLRPASRP